MAVFLQWTLPMPVVAVAGGTEDLPTMLMDSFGASPNGWDQFWVTYYPASQLQTWDFSYWNLAHPSVATWFVDGADIGGGFNHQAFVPGGSISTAVLHAGNDIGPLAYVTVPTSGMSGSFAEYVQYSIMVIDPHVLSPVAGHGEPTPQDIVDTAYRCASYYGLVPNDNDCHYIAAAVGAATGACLTDNTQSLDPTQNEEGGFWRIVYRGSDPNPVPNWQTLVQPGDIVRMGWSGGGQHTTTVLAVNPDHSMVVYDNTDPDGNGGTVIGVHTVNFDQDTLPGTVTIYRLAGDGLYLENGTSLDESLPGTVFNDHVLGFGGDDTLSGALGADVLDGGPGNDTLLGGSGIDTAVFSGNRAAYTVTHNGATLTVSGPDGTDALTSIERLQFADSTVAVAVPQHDFNGDDTSDVMFIQPGVNFNSDYEWQMNDRSIASAGGVDLFDKTFSVQVTGDFNGDGKADVLFENPATAGVWEWQLDGTSIAAQGAVDVGATTYHILGTADFNGDGMSDVLWRSDSGLLYEWQMNGMHDTGGAIDSLDPSLWHVVGAGDFTGDGKADILFHYQNAGNSADSANGAFDIWQMDGSTVTAALGVERPDPSWQILGVGDFNGDGIADIAIRNVSATPDNGAVWVYLMAGTITTHPDTSKTADIQAQGAAGIADPATWHVQTIGDLNGDGKDDILFRNDAGYFYSWDMNGTHIASEGLAGTQAGNWADPSLHVVGQHWDLV